MRIAFNNSLVETDVEVLREKLISLGVESGRIEIKKIDYFFVLFITEVGSTREIFELEQKIEFLT